MLRRIGQLVFQARQQGIQTLRSLLARGAQALVLELEVSHAGFKVGLRRTAGMAAAAQGLFQLTENVQQALSRARVGQIGRKRAYDMALTCYSHLYMKVKMCDNGLQQEPYRNARQHRPIS